ncbi:hypothetical protein UK23_01680 [Lentzea aerocolonigenes]|uniref:Secreted protein n=1 Tax=Lentzea aerocolonigenes TaxID=68170 RepID=A0A0F0HH69_LENAE|nr:hypothetical protein UK23_01680 [Lentzea aerocolonigenes]
MAAVLMFTGITLLVPSTASATTGNCVNGANGFANIPDNLSGTDVEDVPTRSGHWLYLNFGTVNGVRRGWAQLFEGHFEPLSRNVSVWLDWSRDGGRTWIQCGPFYNGSGKSSITSAAQRTSSAAGWVFRAGAMDNGEMALSRWH